MTKTFFDILAEKRESDIAILDRTSVKAKVWKGRS